MINFFKKRKLKKELKKRIEQEFHLETGGCLRCWDFEKQVHYFATYTSEVLWNLTLQSMFCPIPKKLLTNTEVILDNLPLTQKR